VDIHAFTSLPEEIGQEAIIPLAVGAQRTVDLMGFSVKNTRELGAFVWENNIVCFAAIDIVGHRIWVWPQNNEDTYGFYGQWDEADSGATGVNGVIEVTWTADAQ
jgi:hypothetical protein